MCGFLTYRSAKKLMPSKSLLLRGPDEKGSIEYFDFKMNSYRLSIVGEQYGIQPTSHKESHLVYNGEIYNYIEIADKYNLSKQAFKSDTVCLHELIEKISPEKAIKELEGHYSFVWLDKLKDQIYFARDPMGVKPLFYFNLKDEIIITSDIQTLNQYFINSINKKSILEAIIFGGHTGEHTLFSSIKSTIPGSLYSYSLKNNQLIKIDYPTSLIAAQISDDGIYDLLNNSVLNQSKTVVPTACLVSSGIDSNIIKRLIPRINPINFVCAISEDFNFDVNDVNNDEDTIKLPIRSIYSMAHFKEWIQAYGTVPAHNNYIALCILYKLIASNSELNHPNRIKVALTGEGADEYFGGYGRYIQLKKYLNGYDSHWINQLKTISKNWMFLMNSRLHHNSLKWLKEKNIDLDGLMEAHVNGTGCDLNEELSLKLLSKYDIQTNLRYGLHKQDISGMLSSIEVRVPMVTQQLHFRALNGALANASTSLSKLRLQVVAKKLGINQPKKIGFPVNLEKFIPYDYKPSELLLDSFPFLHSSILPTEIKISFFMIDILTKSI